MGHKIELNDSKNFFDYVDKIAEQTNKTEC